MSTIQAGVNRARPCDWVLVAPGCYPEKVVITTPHLHLRGLNRNTVIVDGLHRVGHGIVVDAPLRWGRRRVAMVAPWVLCAVVVVAADVHRSEGMSVWLLVGLLAAVFVGVPIWIRYGGSKVGPLPFIPNDPVATIFSGQKIAFAAGDLAVGDGLLCENHGVLVGAKVPKPGHTTIAQFAGSEWTATVKVRMRDDGVVIARCA